MIRDAVAADTPALVTLAQGTGVFKPHEMDALQEVLDDYHAFNREQGHRAEVWEKDGQPIGFMYYAPAAMTDRTWYLYWIAVARAAQARGTGARLLRHAEDEIRRRGGRVFFIETSSLPQYDLTRKFYLKHGYEREAVLRDFYADGDDMVVFRKKLAAPEGKAAGTHGSGEAGGK